MRLSCRHVFHVDCILTILKNKWLSPRIVFQFLNCPQCKSIKIDAPHCPPIFKLTSEIGVFQEEVQKKALLRIKFEDLDKDPRLKDPNDDFYNNLQAWAMFKLAYYQCFKCKEAYFGGQKDCIRAQQEQQEFKPEELVCSKCAALSVEGGQKSCKKHGMDFIDFKCRFCCAIANWFCWGTTHFCDDCHKRQCKGDYLSKYKKDKLPQCTGGKKCPLGIEKHPPNGDEYSMGCSICRNDKDNIKNF